jgi:hypothetical protein
VSAFVQRVLVSFYPLRERPAAADRMLRHDRGPCVPPNVDQLFPIVRRPSWLRVVEWGGEWVA